MKLPSHVAKLLGYYVYLYVDPSDGEPFYVGKGKGKRVLAHGKGRTNRRVASRIRNLKKQGLEPRIELLAHGLPSAEVAFHVGAAVIDALGLENLSNSVRGWKSRTQGRAHLTELLAQLSTKQARIKHPCLLIRVNKFYRPDMPSVELYDATRSAWRVGSQRNAVRYALAVFGGTVREVYQINAWFPAGTTFVVRHNGDAKRRPSRHEFVGTIAPDSVRKQYLNRFVGHLFPHGNQNPVRYVFPEPKEPLRSQE